MNAEGVKIEIAPVLWQVYGLGVNIVELRVEGFRGLGMRTMD